MSLLLLWSGASATSLTPIAFGNTVAILVPDEVATGVDFNVYMEIVDSSGSVVQDQPPQIRVYGFDSGGERQLWTALTQMSQVGSSNLWAHTVNISNSGVFELVVVGKVGGVAYAATAAVTVRSKFDPIGLAVDDVLVSRMDGEDPLNTV